MKIHNQKGTSLLLTILIMGALLAIAIGASRLAIGELKLGRDITKSLTAYYAADTGIEQALYLDTQGQGGQGFNGCLDYPEDEICYEVTFDTDGSNLVITSNGSYKDTRRAVELTKAVTGAAENVLTNGDFEIWNSTVDAGDWGEDLDGGSSTVNQESSDTHGGNYSCRIDADGDGNYASVTNGFTISADILRLIVWHRESIGSGEVRIYLRDSTQTVFWDGTQWTTSVWTPFFVPNATSWTEYETQITKHPSYDDYYIELVWSEANESAYLDDISITSAP